MITKINEALKKNIVEALKQQIIGIQFVYQKVTAANFKLLEYCKFLLYNYSQNIKTPNYHLLQSINDLRLNKPENVFKGEENLNINAGHILLQRNMLLLNVFGENNEKMPSMPKNKYMTDPNKIL